MSHKHAIYLVYALIASSMLFVASIIVFFLGYQLAIYQTANNDTWFPHVSVTPSQPNNCIYNGTNSSPDLSTNCCYDSGQCAVALKPAIYLYPTHTQTVHVAVDFPAGFSTSIPKYNTLTGWNVIAQPNGTLTNISDNKIYPYLYWEGNPQPFNFDMTKGFIVSGNQSGAFLNKELPIIGLNKNETREFMAYWLPKLQLNTYSLIHFASSDYTNVAKLNITPTPQSVLRVFMVEQPLTHTVPVTPQTFPTFHRSGFTAVEWGGTIKSE